MLELLTGTGLALAAGLNAWIPLVIIGGLDRFTGLVELPSPWAWLSNEWVLLILVALLVLEFIADKIPGVDSINDVVQTVVRPTAGGIAFGSGADATTIAVTDPEAFFTTQQWVPIAVGVVIALGMHLVKAAARPVVNAMTAGVGAPAASFAEDAGSVAFAFAALLAPVLVLLGIALVVVLIVMLVRRLRTRRARQGHPPITE